MLAHVELMVENNWQSAVGSVSGMLNLALLAVAGLLAVMSLGIIPLYALFLASGYALGRRPFKTVHVPVPVLLKTVHVPVPVLLMDEEDPQQPAVAALLVLMMVCVGLNFAPFG
jgi:hypothetical protein